MPIPTTKRGGMGNYSAQATTMFPVFGSAYMGSVRYYAALLAAGKGVIDTAQHIGKHSWKHNHCRILGANGVQTLAVPIEKCNSLDHKLTISDLKISEHGDWRRIHWGAIFSAYGKTPFFEYIEDDLKQVYDRNDKRLPDFNMALPDVICEFLDLPVSFNIEKIGHSCDTSSITDLRESVGGKCHDDIAGIDDVPYYNTWSSRHGFIPDLSILDLLMNNGRESIFTLMKMTENKNMFCFQQ